MMMIEYYDLQDDQNGFRQGPSERVENVQKAVQLGRRMCGDWRLRESRDRLFKTTVRQGRSERDAEAYFSVR
jgi:hypothetical protein